ncbi:hypothetical protein [Paenibacillus sp. OV219]|uniref:hypothetical protein n=1 Tax=Paenibacillus sp. OV219 TaxID=1884377 RepID=UPI0008C4FEC2|nr:hypothetical protein [Paenibacillus sp. OV219]SEO74780.1 hypothetical protein SAMN05518847_110116 [Paenibacillus sp. OV219]
MTKWHSDEPHQADPLLDRLKQRPQDESRVPSEQHIADIQRLAASERNPGRRRKRLWLGWSAAAAACLVLLIAFAYVYEIPGGIADWRYSRAAGYTGTVSIPIGKTPEDAVKKFRAYTSMVVVNREPIDGGMLLFIKRFYQQDGTDLEIEFVRKTWLGWKWVMGGMYGLGSPVNSREAFNYMSMPKFEGIHGPFPIVFGQLSNSSIKAVNITIGGPDAGSYPAKIVEFDEGQWLWFAVLPQTSAPTYGIEAHNSEGAIVASTTFDDPREMNSVPMKANTGVQVKPFILTDILKVVQDQQVKLVPYGITGHPQLLDHVTPQVFAVEAESQTDQSDPEFVHIYVFPSREARVKGVQQFNDTMKVAQFMTVFPFVYEKGNALLIYWAKSKDNPLMRQVIDAAMNEL